MKENTMVSIIIATYNASTTLRAALDSVKRLSINDWECIIVDGKSKDNTVAIIEEYSNNDERFKYISENDTGIYDAFNKGWKLSVGEWIIYLGSDDEFLETGIEQLLERGREADVIYGDTILDFGVNIKLQVSKKSSAIIYGPMACHQSILMRKKVINRLGGFNLEYKFLSDYDLLTRAYKKGFIFKHIKAVVSKYNIRGTSNSNYMIANKERFLIMKSNKSVWFPELFYIYHVIRTSINQLIHKFKK